MQLHNLILRANNYSDHSPCRQVCRRRRGGTTSRCGVFPAIGLSQGYHTRNQVAARHSAITKTACV
jgi:hypothetical protein